MSVILWLLVHVPKSTWKGCIHTRHAGWTCMDHIYRKYMRISRSWGKVNGQAQIEIECLSTPTTPCPDENLDEVVVYQHQTIPEAVPGAEGVENCGRGSFN